MSSGYTVLFYSDPFAIVKPSTEHTIGVKGFPEKLVKEYLPLLSDVEKAFGPERFAGQKMVAFIGGGAAVAHAGLTCTYQDVDVFVLCSSSELAEAVCTDILWKGVQEGEEFKKLLLASEPSPYTKADGCLRVVEAREVPTGLEKDVGYYTQFVLCYCPDLEETTHPEAAIQKWITTFDLDICRCYVRDYEEEAIGGQVDSASVAVSVRIDPRNPRASIIEPFLESLASGQRTSLDLRTLDRVLKYEARVFSSRRTIAEFREAARLDPLRNIVEKAALFIRKEQKLWIAPYEAEPRCMCFLECKNERRLSEAVRKALGTAAENWFCHSECLWDGAVRKDEK